MNVKDREKFLVMQAIYARLGKEVKTGKHDNLRGQFDDELENLYSDFGASKVDLKINGAIVGTATRVTKAGKPKVVGIDIDDREKLAKWMAENCDAFYQQICDYIGKTGDVPDGVRPISEDPAESTSWTIRGLDGEKIAAAIGETTSIPALLMGGDYVD